MPIVAASNGVRPEIRALAVIKLNKQVTPKEINDHVGTGDYAAKYISFLRNRYGFSFDVVKDGRQVVAYVCTAEPKNVAELRGMKPKEKAAKVAKATAVKPAKTKTAQKNTAAKAALSVAKGKAKAAKSVKKFDPVEETFGSTGEIAASFSVDSDWDSMDGVDVRSLVA